MYSEAFERKLGPIYAAIDGRSYKNALKHIDAALKKYSGNQLLLALRAFALQKTNRQSEALAALQSIVDQGPENDRVLNTMTYAYRAAGETSKITAAYAVAAEKRPFDLEILLGLFGAYAKELNFVKQQQIALKLTKLHPDQAEKYSWWTVASLALQARAAVLATPPAPNAAQLMKLAETMASRQIARAGGGLPSYEALLLQTDILQGQGKAAEAAALIRETKGAAGGLAADSRQLLAAVLVRAGELNEAAGLYKEACLENPDDWWSWHLYLNCTLPVSVLTDCAGDLSAAAQSGGSSVFSVGVVGGLAEAWDSQHLAAIWKNAASKNNDDSTIAAAKIKEAEDTLAELILKSTATSTTNTPTTAETENATSSTTTTKTTTKAPRIGRGVVLAPLELTCRLVRAGVASPQQLAEAIAAALPSMRHSFSCAVDLRRYLGQLILSTEQSATTADEREQPTRINERKEILWLLEQVDKICEDGAAAAEEKSASVTALWCRVNGYAIRNELGCMQIHGSTGHGGTTNSTAATAAVEQAVDLITLFSTNLHLSENFDAKERGHGEDLVALAATTLIDAVSVSNPPNNTSNNNTNSSLLLVAAVMALEAAQIRRTVTAPLRLSSCALYGLLSCPKLAAAQLTALDVKSILHETLTGHWLIPFLLSGAAPAEEWQPWLSGIMNVHVDQIQDASESIFTAYEEGTYSKLPEFVDFWETLARSHTLAVAKGEETVATLITAAATTVDQLREAAQNCCCCTEEEAAATGSSSSSSSDLDVLRFNEDLSTRPSWFDPGNGANLRSFVLQWWENKARNGGDGGVSSTATATTTTATTTAITTTASTVWWGVTFAGERQCPEAVQWRTALKNGLQQRRALPKLLAGLLQTKPLPVDKINALEQLLNEAWDEKRTSPLSQQQPCMASKDLCVAGVMVLKAVSTTTTTLNDDDNDYDIRGQVLSVACTSLEKAEETICAALSHSTMLLKGSILPLPGNSGIALAAALLTEEARWSAMCLSSWVKLVKECPSSSCSSLPAQAKEQLLIALSATVTEIFNHITALDDELAVIASVDVEAAVTGVLEELRVTWRAERLWEYEKNFDAKKVLKEMLTEQKTVVGRLHAAAIHALKIMKPLLG